MRKTLYIAYCGLMMLCLNIQSVYSQHLYRISGNGMVKPSFALGTMHTIPAAYTDSIYGLHAALELVYTHVDEDNKTSSVIYGAGEIQLSVTYFEKRKHHSKHHISS